MWKGKKGEVIKHRVIRKNEITSLSKAERNEVTKKLNEIKK